jgi:GxxExxY protein
MSIETSSAALLAGDLTGAIIGAFFRTYNDLGSGFPEHIARRALAIVMREAGMPVEEEVSLPVWFHGTRIATFRADLIVAERVIVEVKASRDLEKVHAAQVAHYLKATDLEVGLLVNFGSRPQFQRVIFQNDRKRRQFDATPEISP